MFTHRGAHVELLHAQGRAVSNPSLIGRGTKLMRAHLLHKPSPVEEGPLMLEEVPTPEPSEGELLVRVLCCGICRTDLHIVEGELPPHKQPIIPGHQVVGIVEQLGRSVEGWQRGDLAGIAWLRGTCQQCRFCQRGRENLCEQAVFTGWDQDGGYAEYALVPAEYAYKLPPEADPLLTAPLLCAGIIGYRALKRADVRPGSTVGIIGFGSSAHIVMEIASYWGCEVYVFSRQPHHQELARQMGAAWVGTIGDEVPRKLDHAILFAPAGRLVPHVLSYLDKGGILAIAGIYLSPIPELDYEQHLYYEKEVRSVTANTREDGHELLELAARIPIRPQVTPIRFEDANDGLLQLKRDRFQGSGVLVVSER